MPGCFVIGSNRSLEGNVDIAEVPEIAFEEWIHLLRIRTQDPYITEPIVLSFRFRIALGIVRWEDSGHVTHGQHLRRILTFKVPKIDVLYNCPAYS
jgi:hypothetical protein